MKSRTQAKLNEEHNLKLILSSYKKQESDYAKALKRTKDAQRHMQTEIRNLDR